MDWTLGSVEIVVENFVVCGTTLSIICHKPGNILGLLASS